VSDETQERDGDEAKGYEAPAVEDLDTNDGPAMTAGSGPGITTPG
jgi:hypothetical protein